MAVLDEGGAWIRTGQSFFMYRPGNSDRRGEQTYRYYGLPNARLDSHFFTINLLERDHWPQEACSTSGKNETDNAFEAIAPNIDTGNALLERVRCSGFGMRGQMVRIASQYKHQSETK